MSPHRPAAETDPDKLGGLIGILLTEDAEPATDPVVLRRESDGTPSVAAAVRALRESGCAEVIVVLGTEVDQARALVPADAIGVYAPDWQHGRTETLRTGLASSEALITAPPIAVAVASLETAGDLASMVRRLSTQVATFCLVRAAFDGTPGYPMLVGREHWRPIARSLSAEGGVSGYLRDHGAITVECGDLGSGPVDAVA